MARISVIGESLVDVVGRRAYPGGSPLNVAVGLARLGHQVSFHTEFGLDEHGALIAGHLRAAGVTLADGTQRLVATNQAQVKLDAQGRASYRFNINWNLPDDVVPPRTDLLHAGSIAAWLEPGASKVREAFAQSPAHQLRSYDPNIRPELAHDAAAVREAVEFMMGRSHVVKLSESDASWLYPQLGPAAVLERVLELGPRLVVLTRGALGCQARTATDSFALPAPATEVVDTVGAGAAFMSGLLDAILTSDLPASLTGGPAGPAAQPVRTALQAGLASAALTVARSGANPPTGEQLHRALQRGN